MTELKIYNQQGKETGSLNLKDTVWDGEVNAHVLHLTLKKQLAGNHQGTHCTKRRDEVSGTGKKPWKQKGTGRARSGSVRSPLWRHGGVVFGPRPRSHAFATTRQFGKLGLLSALRNLIQDGKMSLLDDLKIQNPKTKEVASLVKKLNSDSALFLIDKKNETLERAAKNLPFVKVLPIGNLNVHDLLRFKKVLLTKETLQSLEKNWQETPSEPVAKKSKKVKS